MATKPGLTALQHTPRPAHASDWDRVRPASPALDAPYPPLFPNARIACWDATLMIRPQPRAAMDGPNRWPSRNGAVRFTASSSSHWPSASSPSGGRRLTPAALTRMSGSPNTAAARSAASLAAARPARSPGTQAARPPADWMAAAARASGPSRRASSTTAAPARASEQAIAWPIPELPPVTRATRPSREKSRSR